MKYRLSALVRRLENVFCHFRLPAHIFKPEISLESRRLALKPRNLCS
jgi:hypothetical protein